MNTKEIFAFVGGGSIATFAAFGFVVFLHDAHSATQNDLAITHRLVACKSVDDYDNLRSTFQNDGNVVAGLSLMTKLMSGDCTFFEEGDKVKVYKVSDDNQNACFIRDGMKNCYWSSK
jgi:hypothetical protein